MKEFRLDPSNKVLFLLFFIRAPTNFVLYTPALLDTRAFYLIFDLQFLSGGVFAHGQ